jgi:hypothetical protein
MSLVLAGPTEPTQPRFRTPSAAPAPVAPEEPILLALDQGAETSEDLRAFYTRPEELQIATSDLGHDRRPSQPGYR